jgi:hypothetical protein
MQVVQNMIFVWGSSSPGAAEDAEATPVPVISDLEVVEGTPRVTASGHRIVPNFDVSSQFLALR